MTAQQAPPSLGFSRQEHWSGLPFPSPMLVMCVCVVFFFVFFLFFFAKDPRIEHITYVDMLGFGVALTCIFAQVGQIHSQHYECELTFYFVSAASSCVF